MNGLGFLVAVLALFVGAGIMWWAQQGELERRLRQITALRKRNVALLRMIERQAEPWFRGGTA